MLLVKAQPERETFVLCKENWSDRRWGAPLLTEGAVQSSFRWKSWKIKKMLASKTRISRNVCSLRHMMIIALAYCLCLLSCLFVCFFIAFIALRNEEALCVQSKHGLMPLTRQSSLSLLVNQIAVLCTLIQKNWCYCHCKLLLLDRADDKLRMRNWNKDWCHWQSWLSRLRWMYFDMKLINQEAGCTGFWSQNKDRCHLTK